MKKYILVLLSFFAFSDVEARHPVSNVVLWVIGCFSPSDVNKNNENLVSSVTARPDKAIIDKIVEECDSNSQNKPANTIVPVVATANPSEVFNNQPNFSTSAKMISFVDGYTTGSSQDGELQDELGSIFSDRCKKFIEVWKAANQDTSNQDTSSDNNSKIKKIQVWVAKQLKNAPLWVAKQFKNAPLQENAPLAKQFKNAPLQENASLAKQFKNAPLQENASLQENAPLLSSNFPSSVDQLVYNSSVDKPIHFNVSENTINDCVGNVSSIAQGMQKKLGSFVEKTNQAVADAQLQKFMIYSAQSIAQAAGTAAKSCSDAVYEKVTDSKFQESVMGNVRHVAENVYHSAQSCSQAVYEKVTDTAFQNSVTESVQSGMNRVANGCAHAFEGLRSQLNSVAEPERLQWVQKGTVTFDNNANSHSNVNTQNNTVIIGSVVAVAAVAVGAYCYYKYFGNGKKSNTEEEAKA